MTEPAPLQLRLDEIEKQIPAGRPLVPLRAVTVILDRDEDGVKYLYESGLLQVAVDIGDKGAKRKEIRIWRGSVIAYMRDDRSWLKAENRDAADARAVTGMLRESVPPAKHGGILLSRLVDLWTVSSTHLHDLLSAGELTLAPGQTLKAKQSPLLVRSSVVEFLKRRRV